MSQNEQLSKRVADCVKLEMRYNGESFLGYNKYNSDFNIHYTEITCMTEEEWDKTVAQMTTELEKRKANYIPEADEEDI